MLLTWRLLLLSKGSMGLSGSQLSWTAAANWQLPPICLVAKVLFQTARRPDGLLSTPRLPLPTDAFPPVDEPPASNAIRPLG